MRARLLALLAASLLTFPFTGTSAMAGQQKGFDPPLLASWTKDGPAPLINIEAGEQVMIEPAVACGSDARRVRLVVGHFDFNTESESKYRDVIISDLEADGHWSDSFPVPADFGAQGGFLIAFAECRYPAPPPVDGPEAAPGPATMQYEPALIRLVGSIDAPATASPGETVTISGDVCPNAKVTVRVNGEQVQSTPVTSNPDGTWSVEITIPDDAEIGSTIQVDARCDDRDRRRRLDGPSEQVAVEDVYNYFPVSMTVVTETEDAALDDAETADPVVNTPTVTG